MTWVSSASSLSTRNTAGPAAASSNTACLNEEFWAVSTRASADRDSGHDLRFQNCSRWSARKNARTVCLSRALVSGEAMRGLRPSPEPDAGCTTPPARVRHGRRYQATPGSSTESRNATANGPVAQAFMLIFCDRAGKRSRRTGVAGAPSSSTPTTPGFKAAKIRGKLGYAGVGRGQNFSLLKERAVWCRPESLVGEQGQGSPSLMEFEIECAQAAARLCAGGGAGARRARGSRPPCRKGALSIRSTAGRV